MTNDIRLQWIPNPRVVGWSPDQPHRFGHLRLTTIEVVGWSLSLWAGLPTSPTRTSLRTYDQSIGNSGTSQPV